jgi:hypothetical protein
VRISNTEQFRYFDGSWHLVTLKPLPLSTGDRMRNNDRDILLDRRVYSITPEEAQQFYGAAVYATAMRRLARREVRQYPIPIEPTV